MSSNPASELPIGPLNDPSGADHVTAAAQWLQSGTTGSVAFAIAALAIAAIGFLALTGRLAVRRGMRVVLGCFILFGAPGIAAGLIRLADHDEEQPAVASVSAAPMPLPSPTAAAYDPTAGAGVPIRQ